MCISQHAPQEMHLLHSDIRALVAGEHCVAHDLLNDSKNKILEVRWLGRARYKNVNLQHHSMPKIGLVI